MVEEVFLKLTSPYHRDMLTNTDKVLSSESFGRSFLFNISNFQNRFQAWCSQIETSKYFLQYRHNPVDDDNTPGGIFSPWLVFGLLVLGRLHTNQRSRDSKEKSLHFYHCFTFISCIILFVFLQEMLAYILKAKKYI